MAMTNDTLNPAPKASLSVTAEQVKAAAAKIQQEAKDKEEALRQQAAANQGDELDVLSEVASEFKDQVTQEENQAAKVLQAQALAQSSKSEKNISDLCEEDAYNLEVAISAKGMSSPDFLKIVLKDKNYIARWCNRNPVRMSQLVGQQFRMVKPEHVVNLSSLDMFLDAQGNFVYADLVAMQIPKNIYYAGLRRAYLKSLHATQNKKAAEAGAAFATSRLQGELTGAERSYMAAHDLTEKPIYNPNLGV